MSRRTAIRIAHSCLSDPQRAVEELALGLLHSDTTLVIFFCSNSYDRTVLASEIRRRFQGMHVVGCTTAGEIGDAGLSQQSLVGVGFSAPDFIATSGLIPNLQQFQIAEGHALANELLYGLQDRVTHLNAENCFGFLLIDGLSVREEQVTHAIQDALGNIAMIGGSAADDLLFHKTYVYCDGDFHADSALLLLVHTSLPFKIFKAQHFVPTAERLVVTHADARRRIVHEINGLPAAPEYARLIGVMVEELSPEHFAAAPVVVAIDGNYYVRAIRSANEDQSLTFYCAIEEGLVLRVARGVDPIESLQQAFAEVRAQIGQPQVTLACDCILRKLELVQRGLTAQAEQILSDNKVIGFNTYGEQFRGVHVNQTFAAVAIGAVDRCGEDD
ncbi:nitric oxide-sensing protein NosP [Methylomonas sp. MO1]|uniref:nitric oxide-sensing protein NosP n=1 Tax=unclassified Methylomonas TaxID=2608980 RepID=UPI000479E680|nr:MULTISPECIES: nitric oxide-sensing protein NosP [unclassified Methylomonas]MDT4288208.1 nitric oxide-sensing protein NosP [Methylomonas sp. MO1]